MTRYVCPSCLEPYNLAATPFRCHASERRCPREVDPVLQKFWGDERLTGKVIPPGRTAVDELVCPSCGDRSRKRICPRCHEALPVTTRTTRQLILAIVGAKEAGKSHYIAILVDQLQSYLAATLQCDLLPLNDETMRRYRDDFYGPIFRDHHVVRANDSAMVDRTVQKPLLYRLDFPSAQVVLAFFDTAGEDLDDTGVMEQVNQYIWRSDGILLLVDPLQMREVRGRLEGKRVALPETHTRPSEIVNRIAALVAQGRGLPADGRLPIPLAVALTKFDALAPLLDPGAQYYFYPSDRPGWDQEDFDAVSGEVQGLLHAWGEDELTRQACRRFVAAGFFGLTALGCNPHGSGRIPAVVPHRVAQPFLWLLHHHGLVKTVARS